MMKRTFLSVLLGLSILAAGAATPGTAESPAATGVQAKGKSEIKPHAPDRVIVKFKNGIEVDLGLQKIKHFHLIKASVFKVPAGEKAATFVERLSLDPNVEYAELDFEQKVLAIPNDTRFSELWGLHNTGQSGGTADADIDAPEALGLATGKGDVGAGGVGLYVALALDARRGRVVRGPRGRRSCGQNGESKQNRQECPFHHLISPFPGFSFPP